MHVVCYHTGGVATLLVANYWKPKLRNNFSHNTTYIVLVVTLLEVEVHFKPLEGLLSFSLNINRNYHYVTDTDKFTFIGIDFSSNLCRYLNPLTIPSTVSLTLFIQNTTDQNKSSFALKCEIVH